MNKDYLELSQDLVKYFDTIDQVYELLQIYCSTDQKVCVKFNDKYVYSDKTIEENIAQMKNDEKDMTKQIEIIKQMDPNDRNEEEEQLLYSYEENIKRKQLEDNILSNKLLKENERNETIKLSSLIEEKTQELEDLFSDDQEDK